MASDVSAHTPFLGELWCIRHGETDWSAEGRHTGRNDLALNARGLAQADALRAPLANMAFDRVLCSPLLRARTTCERAGLLERAEETPDAMEWNYGEYEGRTSAEIRAERPGWTIWTNGVLGGETLADVGERATRVLALVRADIAAGSRIALVAHGHFLRVLAATWIDLPPHAAAHLALSPAHIGVLGFEHETPVITRWNS